VDDCFVLAANYVTSYTTPPVRRRRPDHHASCCRSACAPLRHVHGSRPRPALSSS
jgi:hypothetical protein